MREHQEVKIQIEKNMKKYLEPLYKRESEINAKSADIYRILTDEIANPHSFIRQNTQHYFNIKNKKYMSFLKLGKQLKAGNHDHEIDEDIAESTRRAYQDIVSGKDDIEKKISMAITPLYFQNILIGLRKLLQEKEIDSYEAHGICKLDKEAKIVKGIINDLTRAGRRNK